MISALSTLASVPLEPTSCLWLTVVIILALAQWADESLAGRQFLCEERTLCSIQAVSRIQQTTDKETHQLLVILRYFNKWIHSRYTSWKIHKYRMTGKSCRCELSQVQYSLSKSEGLKQVQEIQHRCRPSVQLISDFTKCKLTAYNVTSLLIICSFNP